ncbi:uncharacterized protein EAE98_004339 [Botrytis deweyae]|uniref:Berberine/berberine-like domain-containing protein n=1 Tax=Botrytis deweyae TaxID=2478750 RepID=A0ABQ7IQL8_9HELO|nr:uncharacterized protein EAE98_004339 [Botrytis deweyae]KAF7931603.1 hypothetical protein EAE98_004339 [Botrytis deweyae]
MTSIFSSMLALLPSMVPFASYEAMSTPIIPSTCRCFPGDKCYPSISDWDSFNQTIGGKLIATVPIAAVCHNDQFATYNAIAFNTTTTDDVKEAVTFANLLNIRLMIRTTGHDYNNKSTPVIGSGVVSKQTYEFADTNNGIIVARNCPTIALASSSNFQSQNFLTNTIGPTLTALTPDGAAYLNEADFQQPDWKRVFYGANYDRLDAVKAKYDPLYTFYALRAVGSDLWVERKDGHLCEA